MSDDQINIAIAEWCGLPTEGYYCPKCKIQAIVGYQDRCANCDTRMVEMPRHYTTDLNAMHETEEKLGLEDQCGFIEHLEQIIRLPENLEFGDKPTKKFPLNHWGRFAVAHATARQRAEALMRTLSLWRD